MPGQRHPSLPPAAPTPGPVPHHPMHGGHSHPHMAPVPQYQLHESPSSKWGKKDVKRGELYGLIITATVAIIAAVWVLSRLLFVPSDVFFQYQLNETKEITELKGSVKTNSKEVGEVKMLVKEGFQDLNDKLDDLNITGPNRSTRRSRRSGSRSQ